MADLVLSASSVAAYRKCHYRWYLDYVERRDGESSVRQVIGLAVHAGAETYYRAILAGDTPTHEEAIDDYDLVAAIEMLAVGEFDEDPAKAIEAGRRTLVAYLEDVAPDIDPVMVEQGGEIVVNGITYSFYFDVTDKLSRVHDIKVKVAKPRFVDDYAFQMTGLALGFRAMTGTIESDVILDNMVRLKRDRPYHHPIANGGPVSDHSIRLFAAILERAATGIETGDYRPTGIENGSCSYCPHRRSCEAYAAINEGESA